MLYKSWKAIHRKLIESAYNFTVTERNLHTKDAPTLSILYCIKYDSTSWMIPKSIFYEGPKFKRGLKWELSRPLATGAAQQFRQLSRESVPEK